MPLVVQQQVVGRTVSVASLFTHATFWTYLQVTVDNPVSLLEGSDCVNDMP